MMKGSNWEFACPKP